MKGLDRFREKPNYLRNQKKEFGLWKTFKKNFNEPYNIPKLLNYKNQLIKGPNKMANIF